MKDDKPQAKNVRPVAPTEPEFSIESIKSDAKAGLWTVFTTLSMLFFLFCLAVAFEILTDLDRLDIATGIFVLIPLGFVAGSIYLTLLVGRRAKIECKKASTQSPGGLNLTLYNQSLLVLIPAVIALAVFIGTVTLIRK